MQVQLPDGCTSVLRLYSERTLPDALQLKAAVPFWQWIDRLQPHWSLSLPLPETLPFAWPPGLQKSAVTIRCRWTPGQSLTTITPTVCFQIGKTVRYLHDCAADFRQPLSLPVVDAMLMRRIARRARNAPFIHTFSPDSVSSFCVSMEQTAIFLEKYPVSPAHYGIIHTDLHIGNWLQNNGELIPLDFDYTAYGHYLTDLAVVFHDIGRVVPAGAARTACRRGLLEGYGGFKNAIAGEVWSAFQKVALALYLNWSLDPGNASLLEIPAVAHSTREAIEGIMAPSVA